MIRIKKYYVVLTSIFVFIIYLFTLAPSVVQIDSGELAAVQATLGIAHPTGYPLFTMIGYLFSLIPLPFSKIFQLNILATIYCSIGVGVFTYTIKYCLDNILVFRKKNLSKESAKKEKKKSKEQSTEKQIESKKNRGRYFFIYFNFIRFPKIISKNCKKEVFCRKKSALFICKYCVKMP